MLCDIAGIQHTVVFNYAEIGVKDSRFAAVSQMIQDQFLEPTFFLLDFTPTHVETLHRRFPRSRIVGITCPAVDVEAQCLSMLRVRPLLAAAAGSTQQQKPDADKRHKSKYGEDWLDSDSPSGGVKPTAKPGKKK